jgi:hypothetical protein
MADPEQVVYEFDPVSNVRDETGYWRLMKAVSTSCKTKGVPEPTPTGISPLLIPLFAIGLIGMAVMTEDNKKETRGKK